MRAHALVLLVVVAMVAPATPLVGAQVADDAIWVPGQQLVRRGDYLAAQEFFAGLADQSGPRVAPRALLLQARAALADADTETAESVLQSLLTDYPSSDQLASAYFTLEQVRRAAGDCAGAMRALDAYESIVGRTAIGPYAALQRAQCAVQLEDWPGELAAARAALSIEGGGPRLTRIEAFERAAEAELKMGRKKDALDYYNQSLALAGTRAYSAEMLFTTATLGRALGDDAFAADRFRAVVVDYADQARAPGALDALVDMDRGTTISPLQAATVRLNAHDYPTAIGLFDQVSPGSPDWGPAQLSRAEALLKLGNEAEARRGLQQVADGDALHAGSALLRLGQLDERNGDESEAEALYLRMAQDAPDRAAEAFFHVGFTRFVRGDRTGALAAWRTGLASGPPAPALQAQLLYWTSKAAPTGSAFSQDALNQAAGAAPETYYGLRAQEQLSGTLTVASSSPPTSTAWLAPSASEIQERDAWLAGLKITPERLAQQISALPALQRADVLFDLGLRTEASWEIDGVAQQYAQTKDVAHLSGLADWLMARNQPQLVLRVGRQLRDLVGLSGLPRSVQKDVYPAGWGDLVAEQAAQYGVDPLLMLALMRQESSFDPGAQSGAQAMGLTQIVPPTARSIAGRLGRDDFALRDLFKPAVSVEFGTWYLSQLLGDYKGRIFPSLAAYDAGGGNVSRWLQRFGDDPDLLVEQIPFSETQTYLRIVYDNYWHYQALYGRS
ncbi:MAG TPA: transglycosylase SLT domain-containing protein [Chloroflexota bacterium]|nr:transglycosylase SLT domain-containing protein [Chloroflexota bacterium]